MKNSELGYVPEADYFAKKLRSMQQFHDATADDVMVNPRGTCCCHLGHVACEGCPTHRVAEERD